MPVYSLLGACADTTEPTATPKKVTAQPASTTQTGQTAKVQKPTVSKAGNSTETKIVVYRTSIGGFAIQPKVFIDGQEAAKCVPNRATSKKVAPGQHKVTSKTLSEKAVTVSVAEGETVYVKCSISVGLIVGGAKLVVIPAEKAAPKVAKLKQK